MVSCDYVSAMAESTSLVIGFRAADVACSGGEVNAVVACAAGLEGRFFPTVHDRAFVALGAVSDVLRILHVIHGETNHGFDLRKFLTHMDLVDGIGKVALTGGILRRVAHYASLG